MEMEIQTDEAEKIIKSIAIPPRPAVILKVMEERNRPEPDLGRVARLIGGDVGLSAAMMKTVNSPFYGLRNKVGSVQHAVSMLGLSSVTNVATALSLRSSLAGSKAVPMERFWDTSSQIAMISAHAASSLPGVSQEQAYTFGLFRDCGIPVLMQKFPDYKDTLRAANTASDQPVHRRRGCAPRHQPRHGRLSAGEKLVPGRRDLQGHSAAPRRLHLPVGGQFAFPSVHAGRHRPAGRAHQQHLHALAAGRRMGQAQQHRAGVSRPALERIRGHAGRNPPQAGTGRLNRLCREGGGRGASALPGKPFTPEHRSRCCVWPAPVPALNLPAA